MTTRPYFDSASNDADESVGLDGSGADDGGDIGGGFDGRGGNGDIADLMNGSEDGAPAGFDPDSGSGAATMALTVADGGENADGAPCWAPTPNWRRRPWPSRATSPPARS
jgi:hypothetical protein